MSVGLYKAVRPAISDWMWNVAAAYGRVMDVGYAKQWYAKHSAANWASDTMAGKMLATFQDAVGGSLASLTGSPQSAAQAWWALRISSVASKAPLLGVGISAIKAMSTSVDKLTSSPSQPMSLQETASSVLSLAGLAGAGFMKAGSWNRMIGIPLKGEFQPTLFDGSLGQWQMLNQIQSASNIISFGKKISSWMTPMFMSAPGIINQFRSQAGESEASKIGGVLFDKCATITGTSPEITGAYWDSDRGVLVLLGPDNGASDLALSGLEFDHLMVALRAALAGEHIGVSIDPSSEYRDGILSGQFPPAGTPMYVSYLGNTDGTLFGAIMFEADRVMKCLSKGTDNVTGRPLRATKVPGYGSLFDLFNKYGSGGSGSWFRFWFVIDKVEIAHDSSAKAFRFGEVKMKVLNETEMHGSKAPPDPASAAFASHLTDHYDEYADKFPIFTRLRELAKLAALSRYLVNQGAALDSQTIFKQEALPVDTPETTPGICVSAPSNIGSMSIFGGVSMDVLPTIISRDDKLARLTRDLAQSASPGDFASTWRFKGPDGPAVASSIRLGGVDKPYQTKTSSDHTFKKSWNNTIRSIQRYYDSSVPGGDFGPGWWLYLPYRLQVIPAGRKRPEVLLQSEKSGDENPSVVVLHNFIKPGTRIYRRSDKSGTANGLTYCLVSQQSFVKGGSGISYSLNESDRILFKNGRYFYSSGQYTFIFNERGQPCEIKLQDGTMAIYTWDEDLLKKIYFGEKHSYEFDYDQTTLHTRISSIKAADGTILNYTYNNFGLLSDCFQGKSLKVNYRYDQGMRVSEFRDASGGVVKRKVYDSAGNLLDGALQTVVISDNSRIKLEFTNGRLSSVEDGAGSKGQFSYRKDNSLASVAGSVSGYEEWRLDYDEDGKVIGSKDNMGVYTNFYYEPDGQVGSIESDNGLWVQFPDSGSKNPEIKGEHPVWGEWSVGLDNQGLIRNITDAEQNQIQFRYKKQTLKSIKSPGLNVNVVQSNGVSEFRMTGELGIKRRFMHDTYADKIELTVNGPHKEEQHLYIDETHYKLTDIAGQAEYKFDDSELTCEAVFQF